MITNKIPKDWRDLQNQVSTILNEAGITAKVQQKIRTVRGEVEIDVFATEKINSRDNEIVIECKYWKSRIPQNIVHGVRTIVSDIGANVGYIISMKGFQKGAYSAGNNTNVKLLTWEEFQLLFEEKWLVNYFYEYIEEKFEYIHTCAELVMSDMNQLFMLDWMKKLKNTDLQNIKKIAEKYANLGFLLFGNKLSLPIKSMQLQECCRDIPYEIEILNVDTYKELIESIHKYCDPVIQEFNRLKN